ncbi:hypothetical protein Tco_1325611 [Tanacetum coccineum]
MYVERVGMRKLMRITHGFYHACRVSIMQGRGSSSYNIDDILMKDAKPRGWLTEVLSLLKEGEEEGWWYGLDMVATSSKVYTHLALALDTT